MKQPITQPALALFLTLTSAGLISGCAPQTFEPGVQTAQQSAPGTFTIPAQVDILLAQDDTGSMKESFGPISKQLPIFLNDLESKGWDYHFAVAPLTTDRALEQIAASRYDGNWGEEWKEPFPGARIENFSLPSNLFQKASAFSAFLNANELNTSNAQEENGLSNILYTLKNRANGTGFLRPGALLVVIAATNGDDTSGITFCTRSDGYNGPCEDAGQPEKGTRESSLISMTQEFQKLKSNPALIHFYSAVAFRVYDNCLGGRSIVGSRYQKVSESLNGKSYDICTRKIQDVMSEISGHLANTKRTIRTRYLVLPREPEPSSLKISKNPGGNTEQAIPLVESVDNGYTYVGYGTENAVIVDAPGGGIPMQPVTGYLVELHGAAQLSGSDTAQVDFTDLGAKPGDGK